MSGGDYTGMGPRLEDATLLPQIEAFARAAAAYKATRVMADRMEHVWAWVACYDGKEHVLSVAGHPFIDSDLRLLRLAENIVKEIARQARWEIKLVRFDRQGESIETVTP